MLGNSGVHLRVLGRTSKCMLEWMIRGVLDGTFGWYRLKTPRKSSGAGCGLRVLLGRELGRPDNHTHLPSLGYLCAIHM